jgi:hypothetical protein
MVFITHLLSLPASRARDATASANDAIGRAGSYGFAAGVA